MKKRILAITLSLGLLASLFAFAVPVSADPDGAADQAGFIYFEIKLGK
jgi:hypothetical protein